MVGLPSKFYQVPCQVWAKKKKDLMFALIDCFCGMRKVMKLNEIKLFD